MPLPPRHILSKSTFMYGCQCPKRLWLHKFQPKARDEETVEQTAIFQSGTNVGLLARQLFPYGVDASPPTFYQYQLSVADTAKYIRKGVNVIYEAAFQYSHLSKKNLEDFAYRNSLDFLVDEISKMLSIFITRI